jgi:hypothetical protein
LQVLKKVDLELLNELKQLRLAADSPAIKLCEDLAADWISTIENMLSDICDEKYGFGFFGLGTTAET